MQIFIADLCEIIKKKDLESVLSSPKRQADFVRYQSMKSEKRRGEFLVGRWLIHQVVGDEFSVQSSGALAAEKCFLSLAHSGCWVFLAVSDNPIGVDIEDTSKQRDFEKLAELKGFSKPKNAMDFYADFTRYEADFKLGKTPTKHHFYELDDFLICVAEGVL